MSLQVRQRLGVADVMTLLNAVLGVVAMVVAVTVGPVAAAQLILLAAVADGLDGIIARSQGGTAVGPLLDSIADIVSFGTAPALFLWAATEAVIADAVPASLPMSEGLAVLAASAVPAVVVVFSLIRTALYTVHVGEDEDRPGIQNTLAASILVAAYLAGLTAPAVLLPAAVVLSVLMVAPVPYPKLRARDALVMGVVQVGAIFLPAAFGRVFPRALLLAALAYMTLAPRYYWAE
ncbi:MULTISPECIES: protein sorting system archaetidylserine synthase [Salinibaculum]|uniref:protein sorting system archaetidylserine synthase n=1 Tax=Salinibaculum TaxID=2732368 RepID=UPI0030CE8FEC